MAKAKPVKKVARPSKSQAKSSRSVAKPAKKVVKPKPASKAASGSKSKCLPSPAAKARPVTKSVPKGHAQSKVTAKPKDKVPSRPATKPAANSQARPVAAPEVAKPVAQDASKPVAKPVTPVASKPMAAKVVAKPAITAEARSRHVMPQSIPIRPIQVAPPRIQKPAPVISSEDSAALLQEAQRKKGVRKATLTSGVREDETARKLGRSRIPVDAPLEVVFQNDTQAREAFMFLGISSIRELENFTPDELVLRLTGPAKLTVGRIRKILAMNNRCLTGDEKFAMDFQEGLAKPRE